MNYLPYFLELRRRALQVMLVFLVVFIFFLFYANQLFELLMHPLLVALPNSGALITTEITSSLITPIKLAANAAMLLTVPFALWHLWRFVEPGLYPGERHRLRGGIFLCFLLFVVGTIFCYWIILPVMFQLIAKAIPGQVNFMPDMVSALDFIIWMLTVFGLSFQIPLLFMILVRLEWVELAVLKKIRPYAIVGAFILGMLLTPPDIVSQVLLAIPLWLLYEIGIFLAQSYQPKVKR